MRSGPRNLISDVAGLRVGNAAEARLKSGVTVLTGDAPFTAAVQVMGGAPGSRETDLLAPDKLVTAVDALVLSGGSAFGLAACDGVMQALRAAGRHAVVLVDALDEADDAHGMNPVLRLLRDLGGAARGAMSLVVTLRPEPEVSQRVLAYAWGEERTLRLVPAQLRAPLMVGGGGGGAAAISDKRWASALREQAESKIYQIVTRRFALAHAGRGLPPPTATWGAMLAEGRDRLWAAPWISNLSGLAIVIVVWGINMLGNGLREQLDPKAQGRL